MNYTLLRPFDLEAAKRGEPVIDTDGDSVAYMAGPSGQGEICVEFGERRFLLVKSTDLRMAPLCWVEGRPVYKGDVLYRLDTGAEGSATAAFGTGVVCSEWPERPFSADEVTWTRPKVRREGWLNIYPPRPTDDTVAFVSHAHASKDAADAVASTSRLACIRIEWEEPAK